VRYKKTIHYSKCTRYGDKHPGGVEKYAWYLQKAIGCELVTPRDKPNLNDPETLYIVDNHWGLDIGEDCRVVCMLHGCAGERGFNREIGQLQAKMARRPNTCFVANSLETAELCKEYYNSRVDELIHLAVDENLFYPRERTNPARIILTSTAGKHHKGGHLVDKIQTTLNNYDNHHFVIDMRCDLDKEDKWFKNADMFILLSTHEGFAYSILEAMCADLPVITGPHGIGYELKDEDVITVLEENRLWNVGEIVKQIKRIFDEGKKSKTREWVLNNCTLEMFNEKWKKLIEEEQLR
jgi:hypothetical protein